MLERFEHYANIEEFSVSPRQVKKFFGRDGLDYAQAISHGETPAGHLATGLNDYFYRNLARNLGFENPEEVNGRELSESLMYRAAEVEYNARKYLGLVEELEPLNELAALSSQDPARWLDYMYNANIDDSLTFEVRRRLFIGLLLGRFAARDSREGMKSRATEVLDLLDRKLWLSPIRGEVGRKSFYSVHDDTTNEPLVPPVESYDELREFHDVDGTHIKRVTERVRCCDLGSGLGIMPVRTTFRTKPDQTKVFKVLRKMKRLGTTELDIDAFVDDDVDLRFIVMHYDLYFDPRIAMMDLVLETLRDHFGNGISVQEDDTTNVDKGRPKVEWIRRNIFLPGSQIPIQTVFYDIWEYYRSRWEAFTRLQGSDELVFGRAHDLYRLREDLPVFELIFPKRHYPEVDIRSAVEQKQREIANRLIAAYRYPVPNNLLES